MEPLSYLEWCATEERIEDPVRRRERYQAYVAGVMFIRSQIGGLPRPGWSRLPSLDASVYTAR